MQPRRDAAVPVDTCGRALPLAVCSRWFRTSSGSREDPCVNEPPSAEKTGWRQLHEATAEHQPCKPPPAARDRDRRRVIVSPKKLARWVRTAAAPLRSRSTGLGILLGRSGWDTEASGGTEGRSTGRGDRFRRTTALGRERGPCSMKHLLWFAVPRGRHLATGQLPASGNLRSMPTQGPSCRVPAGRAHCEDYPDGRSQQTTEHTPASRVVA